MNFFEAIEAYFIKFKDFRGRSSRSEYWWSYLFISLTNILASSLMELMLHPNATAVTRFAAIFLISFYVIFLFISGISLSVRRLHDIDKRGWWWFIILIPFIGVIVLMIWACIRGTQGDNRFGPDPLAGQTVRPF